MAQGLRERCLHYCEHIRNITGTTCVLLDIGNSAFVGEPFQHSCTLQSSECNAYHTHLYGAYKAERWDNKYIYYCPRGLIFIATPVSVPLQPLNYCLITGPIIMGNNADDLMYGDLNDLEGLEHVPRMTTAQTRSYSEMIHAAVCYLAGSEPAPDVDSGYHAELLQLMYEISAKTPQDVPMPYPMDSERELQKLIRAGDKEGSQRLLNELLGYIYFASGADFSIIKSRVMELLVVMSRATIDGGADVSEIFWLNTGYVKELERFDNIETLSRWLSAIVHKFISCVFDFTHIKHRDIIFKTTDYIKRHFTEKLTLELVAEQVYLSRSHLSRILNEELGCTLSEYVNRLRVDRSKIFLMNGAMSLADIADAVGFDDQSYFTKVFKKVTGVSPGKYRDQRL